eukprot:12960547-Alexandrium_andersonii.AAC.1
MRSSCFNPWKQLRAAPSSSNSCRASAATRWDLPEHRSQTRARAAASHRNPENAPTGVGPAGSCAEQ